MSEIDSSAAPDEDDIRRLAFHLWEADGAQEGRQDEYWYAARRRLASESAVATPAEPADPHPSDEDAANVHNPAPGGDRASEQRDIKTNKRNPGSTF